MIMDYAPLVISLNYNYEGTQYAMISYGVFTKNSADDITGARIEKQVVIVSNGKTNQGLDQRDAFRDQVDLRARQRQWISIRR